MRYLAWLVKIVVFLVLFAFAIKNTHPVLLHGLLATSWQAPLVVFLLLFFVLGAIAGVLTLLLPLTRLRRELQAARQQLAETTATEPVAAAMRRIEPAQPLDAVI